MSRKHKKAKRDGQGGAVPVQLHRANATGIDVARPRFSLPCPRTEILAAVRSFETFYRGSARLKSWLQHVASRP